MIKSLAAAASKILLVLGILAIGASAMWAGTIVACGSSGTLPNGGASYNTTTLGGLVAMSGNGIACTDTDKIYGNFSVSNFPTAWTASMFLNVLNPLAIIDTFQLTDTSGATTLKGGDPSGTTYKLWFTVSVDPTRSDAASTFITAVQVSNNSGTITQGVPPPTTVDTKNLCAGGYFTVDGVCTGGTNVGSVVAIDGNTDSLYGLETKSLGVYETIYVPPYSSSGWSIGQITDRFVETIVPEPTTMALMGAGLLALGGLLRRKKLAK